GPTNGARKARPAATFLSLSMERKRQGKSMRAATARFVIVGGLVFRSSLALAQGAPASSTSAPESPAPASSPAAGPAPAPASGPDTLPPPIAGTSTELQP